MKLPEPPPFEEAGRRSRHQLKKWLLPLRRRLSNDQFLLLCAVSIGVIAGLAALVLKLYVFQVQKLVLRLAGGSPSIILRFLIPVIGLLACTWIIRRFFKNQFLKGSDQIVLAIAQRRSFLPFSQTYSHLITSGITIGCGGSTGVESPLVSTGAAIGSNVAGFFNLPYRDRTLLLGCGVSAVIAAAFSAPVAGVLFVLEVLLPAASLSRIMPLILSAAAGALFSTVFLGREILLNFPNLGEFAVRNLPFYVALGLMTGLMARWYSISFRLTNRLFEYVPGPYQKAVLGGLMLGLITLILPPLYGEGYETLKALTSWSPDRMLRGSVFGNLLRQPIWFPAVVALILLLKGFLTAITLAGGGVGGNFAPSLFIGGLTGYLATLLAAAIGIQLPVTHFVLAGMAGSLSGIFYAPLTALFLIAEITGGYELMIPLMVVSSISFFTARSFDPLSMEMRKLARQEKLLTHTPDTFVSSRISAQELLYQQPLIFPEHLTLTEAVMQSLKNDVDWMMVVDGSGKWLGLLSKVSLLQSRLNPDLAELSIGRLPLLRIPAVQLETRGNELLKYFDLHESQVLPVVDKDQKPVGLVFEQDLLRRYREVTLEV